MRKILIFVVLCIPAYVYAVQKAVTDRGETVLLNDDGTWQYESDRASTKQVIKTNKFKFKKSSGASFKLKSSKNDTAYWIDTKKWNFKKASDNEDAEYELQLKGKDLYAMAITESIEIPLETLTEIAYTNAKNAAADARVLRKEYRNVNGHNLIYMEIAGTIQGVKFTYLGYYFSNSKGSTQLLTYTASNLVPKYKSEIYELLNGFDVQ